MIDILYEDNHLLVVRKPAGMLTMGDASGAKTMVDLAKTYLKKKYNKPGDVFLGVVHRLDRPVSGVLVFARTSKAAGRLSAQFREHTVEKTYVALIEGRVNSASGTLRHWLWKDRGSNVVSVVAPGSTGSQECVLQYQQMKSHGTMSLLEIAPETGRSHQIRVQLASQGWCIVGDRKYGSRSAWPEGIALHARRIVFEHPTKQEPVTVVADFPASWNRYL